MRKAMVDFPITLEAVNAMAVPDLIAAFGDVAEHSPWVATRAAAQRPFASRRAMIEAFADEVREAGPADKLALLRAHPDLAGRAAVAGEMAADSRREQAGAGLDTLTPEEFGRFTELNESYTAKFGFPFILAVRGADKQTILAAFAERIERDPQAELAMAVSEVARIIGFRIEDRVQP
jgi:2-oxo-4-hydroxy-4-carboxy-5-ureidoimidazoline decarboxylase